MNQGAKYTLNISRCWNWVMEKVQGMEASKDFGKCFN